MTNLSLSQMEQVTDGKVAKQVVGASCGSKSCSQLGVGRYPVIRKLSTFCGMIR